MNWLEQLKLSRQSNLSNVFLVETEDPVRLRQLEVYLKDNFPGSLYRYVLQTQELISASGDVQRVNPLKLLQLLRSKISTILLYWVTTSAEAKNLLPFIVVVSQDFAIYVPEEARRTEKIKPSSLVIVTHSLSYFPENVRRMCVEVSPPVSESDERRKVLESVATQALNFLGLELKVTEQHVQSTSGLNLHEVESAALLSLRLHRDFRTEVFRDFKIQALKRHGLEIIYPTRGFESVGGYNYLKKWFKTRIVDAFRNPELLQQYGESLPRGVLLYGYPGTGKTWFSKALAKELGLPMIKLSASDFLRGIVGETEARVRKIVKLLESLAPAVVFIDEIDQLFLSRGQVLSTDSGVSRRLQNMLLDWLGDENRRTFVIGATNYVEQMDFAVLRVGRFDKIVFVGLPDFEARKDILKVHFEVVRKPKVKISVDYDEVAKLTWLWTGAEIENLVRESLTEARVRREYPTTDLVEKMMKMMNVDINSRKQEIKRMLDVAKRLANIDVRSVEEAQKVLNENTHTNKSPARFVIGVKE